MTRRKKQRVAALDEEAARRLFLEALAAQRANADRQQVDRRAQSDESTPSGAISIPGFYYDATTRRYFRSCPPHRREQIEMPEQKRDLCVQTSKMPVKTYHSAYGTPSSRNWVTYLSHRQKASARTRDSRELIPQFFSGFLVLKVQTIVNRGGFTALALRSEIGAIGAGSGKLDVLRLSSRCFDVKSTTSLQSACSLNVSGMITSLQWRPAQENDLLLCHLGSDDMSGSQTGNVCYFRVRDQTRRGAALLAMDHVTRIEFVDPWTARWNPTDTNKFSVGCGGSSSAAYVDAVAPTSSFQRAPPGAITSEVHAQSFFGTGHVVLNGTTSGALWGWDIRAPRRIFEWQVNATANQPTGSILDIHVLNDCRRAVVQRSNGELRIVDLRTFRPVVELIQGAAKHYLPSLRCAIDSYESIVVSGGDAKYPLTINSYNLRSGRHVASIEMQNAQTSEKRSTFVQQVQLKSGHHESRFEDAPEIWAISRNELYVCSKRTDDPAK